MTTIDSHRAGPRQPGETTRTVFLDSSEFLTEREHKERFVVETIALAAMMVGGDDLVDATRQHINLGDFDGTHRVICKVLLMCRDQGGSLTHKFYEAMFYPEERAAETRHILETYEEFRHQQIHPTGDRAVESLRATLSELRRAETALYLWYDESDTLLYVGITEDFPTRQTSHAKKSSWSAFVTRSRVQRFASRLEAERAEKTVIRTEQPLFNRQHNDTPEARARLVAYLVEKNRLDLLSPAVSRG